MTEHRHTPEPWRFDHGGIYGAESVHISGYDYPAPNGYGRCSSRSYTDRVCEIVGGFDNEARNANAARIVACVNALAGLNPDGVADVVEALRAIADADEKHGHVHYLSKARMAEIARAALAKLEGKAHG